MVLVTRSLFVVVRSSYACSGFPSLRVKWRVRAGFSVLPVGVVMLYNCMWYSSHRTPCYYMELLLYLVLQFLVASLCWRFFSCVVSVMP
jgi:hypothetical protein